ncbi:MAG TPA: hypothetical protein VIM84_14405 [Gemmatimonadales bacterium]
MLLRKAIDSQHEHTEPKSDDLGLIRKFAHRDVAAEEVWCGALHACNTRLDRSGEKFTKAYLERFKETLPGKPVLEGHNYEKRPLGRIYKAEVLPDGDGWFLKTYYYLKADSPLVSEIELGIQKDCSIGFNAKRRVCDLDGKEWHPHRTGEGYCDHWPLEEYDDGLCTLTYCDSAVQKAEGLEMSFVYVGCQNGAQAIEKQFYLPTADGRRRIWDIGLDLVRTDETGMIGARKMPTIEELQQQLNETKAAHSSREAELQREVAELKKQAAEAAWGRDFLKAEIARFAGLLDQEAEYAAILDVMKDAAVAQLEPIYKKLGEKVDAKYAHGAANTDTQDTGGNGSPKWATPFHRPMGGI